MNRIHRTLRDEITGKVVAVPEHARSRGKRGASARAIAAALLGSVGTLGAHAAPDPNALPTQGQVAAGGVSIRQTGANGGAVLDIDQTSARAIINWGSFNVGSNARVNFNQPNASAATLNRVQGNEPSQILGRISAPGQVFLLNPNGVLTGASAQVEVGALLATTHQIGDADFLAGRLGFTRSGATGSVINQGSITAATGGYVALLAPEVRNDGVIVAKMGTVALASGEAVTLQFTGSTLADLTVTPSSIASLVANGRAVEAPGGVILLAAKSVTGLATGMIQNTGTLQATGAALRGGRIVLQASDQVLMTGTSVLDVSNPAGQGGSVTVSGRQIALADSTRIDASGARGGGTIEVGGGWQGRGTVAQATAVYVGAGTVIDASATQLGQGGEIVLWSDLGNTVGATRAYGTLKATGGAQGGDGGRVETSGHFVDVAGLRVDASAFRGAAGQWLLDPYDLNVVAGGVGTSTAATASGPPYTFSSGALATNVANADIQAQLNNGTSVTLQTGGSSGDGVTGGSISVNANIAKSGAALPP